MDFRILIVAGSGASTGRRLLPGLCSVLAILGATERVWGQTIYDWRDGVAPDGDWSGSGGRWWNGSAAVDSPGFGVLRFDNNHQPSMANNLGGTMATHGLVFGASNTTARTLTGDPVRLFDNGGANPFVRNDSSGHHAIDLALEGDGDSGDPLEIQLNGSGNLTFGATIDNRGGFIDIVGGTASAASAIFNGSLSGGGGLYKANGNTTADLNVANSYLGETILAAGTLRAGHDQAFGAGAITLNGGTLASTSAASRSFANALTIGGNVTFGQAAGGTGTLLFSHTGGTGLGGGTRTLTVIQNTELRGPVSNGNLIKDGSATLTLAGGSSFGTLTVNAGSVSLGASTTITGLSGSGSLQLASGTLLVSSGSHTQFDGVISGGGSLEKRGSAQRLTLTGANTYTGGTFHGAAGGGTGGILSLGASSTGGPGSITSGPLGTGTLTIRNTGAASNNYIQSSDATARVLSNAIVFSGSNILANFGGSGNLTLDGTVNLAGGNRTFGVSGITVTLGGTVSTSTSGGSLSKAGNGTLVLSGNNTFNGGTTLSAGTLRVGNANALGSGTLLIDFNDPSAKTLASADATGRTLGNAVHLYNHLTLGEASGGTGSLQLAGDVALGNEANEIRILTVVGSHAMSGVISGQRGLVQQGGGTLELSGANTFAGGLFIDHGTTRIAGGSLAAGTIDIGAGVQSQTGHAAALEIASALDIGRALTVKNFGTGAGDRDLVFSHTTGTAELSGTVTLDKSLRVSVTGSGAEMSGAIGGTGGIIKTGTGTLTLTGGSTYAGATQVQEGTLVVGRDGTTSIVSAVTVQDGATLKGSGSIGALTVEDGGVHAPGNSPGLQTINGGATYNAGSVFEWELAANTSAGRGINFDAVNVNGALTIADGALFRILLDGTGSTVNLADAFWASPQSWTVFSWTGSFSGLAGFTLDTISSQQTPISTYGSFSLGYDPLGKTMNVHWAPVPEPAPALAGLLLAAGVFRRQRRGKAS